MYSWGLEFKIDAAPPCTVEADLIIIIFFFTIVTCMFRYYDLSSRKLKIRSRTHHRLESLREREGKNKKDCHS